MKTISKQKAQEDEEVCNCPNCTYDRIVQAQLATLAPQQKTFFRQMYENYCEVSYKLQETLEGEEEQEDFAEEEVKPIWYH